MCCLGKAEFLGQKHGLQPPIELVHLGQALGGVGQAVCVVAAKAMKG